jgi:dGTPase
VRMADTISYIGRDIEDAIRLNLIKRSQLPKAAVARLGDTNGTIVYNLVTDVIKNSFQRPCIAFSQEVSKALKEFREFNLNHIYLNPKIKPDAGKIRHVFQVVFERYLKDLKEGNQASIIFTEYLDGMSDEYKNNTSHSEIARDFIAGMTDQYFLRQCPRDIRPTRITGRL